jgi:hypothetical protein
MKTEHSINFIREAGYVQRMHFKQHHGDYSVALHTWNMLVLLDQLWDGGDGSTQALYDYNDLVRAILYHDVTERVTGDIPSPAKGMNSGLLRKGEHKIEDIVRSRLQLPNPKDLSPLNQTWLKGLDILELVYWCLDQEQLGNQRASVCLDKALLTLRLGEYPNPIMALLDELEAHAPKDIDGMAWWEWQYLG